MLKKLRDTAPRDPWVTLQMARALLDSSDPQRAQKALDEVPPEARASWEAAALETDLRLLHSGPRFARQFLSSMRDRLPQESAGGWWQARLEARLTTAEGKPLPAAVKEVLWQEIRANSPHATQAVLLLLKSPVLEAAEARELLQLMEDPTSNASTAMRDEAFAKLLHALPAEQRATLITKEGDRVARTRHVETQLRFLDLLSLGHHAAETISYLKKYGALLRERQPVRWLDFQLVAHAQLRHGTELRALLDDPIARQMDPAHRYVWQACEESWSDPASPRIEQHLRKAWETIETRKLGPDHTMAHLIQQSATTLGRHTLAASISEAQATAARSTLDKITALDAAHQSYARARDTTGLLRTARQLVELTPDNASRRLRLAYLQLLTGNDVVLINPVHDAREHLLNAMLLHKQGSSELVQSELKALQTATDWLPGERAVLGGLLLAAGELEQAQKILHQLPSELLMPEEQAWLRKQ